MLISDFKHGLFKYEVKDYYAILGVPISATPKEMRTQYMKLAYKLHPDTNLTNKEQKARTSEILSKVVNPAYKNLYKQNLRKECELIMSDIGHRLAPEMNKVTVSSDAAQKLLVEDDRRLKQIYQETVEKISKDLYQDFSKIPIKVGLLSELNLIYLVRQTQAELRKVTGGTYGSAPIMSSEGVINKATQTGASTQSSSKKTSNTQSSSTEQESEKKPLSRLDQLIISANRYIDTDNYEPAVFDLREAVKLEPNNAMVHALLGLVYLEQSNITYARIHINKAVSLDSKNIKAQDMKERLTQIERKQKKSSQGKTVKDKKGKEKKEAPKIFGIPLW